MVNNILWDMIHGSISRSDLAVYTPNLAEKKLLHSFGINPNDLKKITKPSFNPLVWERYGYMIPVQLYDEYLTAMQFEEKIAYVTEELDEHYHNQNWSKLLAMCDKRLVISQFIEWMPKYKPEETYDLFIDVWTRAENGFEKFTKDILLDIFSKRHFSKEWSERMEEFKKKVAGNKKVRIYHGEQNNGYNVGDLCSWTLSKKIAEFFAYRFDNEARGQVYAYDIPVNSVWIMDYLDCRNEQEVLIYPPNFEKPIGKIIK